jgi:hypothetical protein
VLIEFYAVATHPSKLAMTTAAAQAGVLALQVWSPVGPDSELLRAEGCGSTAGSPISTHPSSCQATP